MAERFSQTPSLRASRLELFKCFKSRDMKRAVSRQSSLWGYLELARPANIVTAWADILAGFAASGVMQSLVTLADSSFVIDLSWLLLATTGLYGGGVVFNDVFDAGLDAEERPERPIPSGRVSQTAAATWGAFLLALGVISAAFVSWTAAALATLVAACALIYDRWGKHHTLGGPINMGLCRGGNLLLGVAVLPGMLAEVWFLALLPIVYIAGITAVSRGEVHGGSRATGVLAVGLETAVLLGLLAIGWAADYSVLEALPFVLLLAGRVLPPFLKAAQNPEPAHIRLAVKAGVLSLIILDAVLVAGFAGWLPGLFVLVLLPLSLGLGKLFDVT